jgi:Rhs element Vgr protein
VQHYCTDWDFMLARAEAGGRVVVVDDGAVTVAVPETSGSPQLAVAYGESLIEFEAELDASHQSTEVRAQAWDAGQQAVLQSAPAGPAALNAQGNLDSKRLAAAMGSPQVRLQTGATLHKDALDAWARAQQLKSGLARLRGRMRFQGSALARVGALIDLSGVGERFSGSAYVTALTHRISDGSWATEAEFGTPAEWFIERPGIVAPPAAGWVPGIEGLHIGIVRKLDGDPAGAHRVQLELPAAQVPAVWARLAQGYASNGFGAHFVPEIGDEVLVGFLANDPACPVVLGSLYSPQRPPPVAPAAGNDVKALVTRSKARLEFHDGDKVITISTPGRNQVVLSDKEEAITLTDQHHNQVRLDAGGITIDSAGDVRITAKGAITVSAVGALSLGSKADTLVEGLNVTCEAQVAVAAKGSATAELSAAGQTTVKGAMVMIN